ncbi:MAG: hypothetical protein IKX20_09560 [Paludibacteraceae bacterium]|nr:hypothetical protein [Paludibacteraceae bacterium]
MIRQRRSYTRAEKLEIIQAFLASGETMETFQNKYGMGHCTLSRWLTNFAITNPTSGTIAIMKKDSTDVTLLKEQKAKQLELESEVARLRSELEAEKLKSLAYSTMIDVAETQFGIEIRKKAGAKQ